MAWVTKLLVVRLFLLQPFEFFAGAALAIALVIFPAYEDDS